MFKLWNWLHRSNNLHLFDGNNALKRLSSWCRMTTFYNHFWVTLTMLINLNYCCKYIDKKKHKNMKIPNAAQMVSPLFKFTNRTRKIFIQWRTLVFQIQFLNSPDKKMSLENEMKMKILNQLSRLSASFHQKDPKI